MRMATWNVQGIRTKQSEVFRELKERNIDIAVLTETKKKGRGNEIIGEYIHFYSGVDKSLRAKRGVSIVVHKKYKKNIKKWEEVDEQIVTLEIEKNGENLVIIGIYAPSEDAGTDVKDAFYKKLEDILIGINKNKEVCILGDLNARVGQKNSDKIVGQYGEETVNNNGKQLINMCQNISLKIMNGYFQHRDIHKFTWVQSTKGQKSIIDYLIMRQNSRLKVTDVRAYRGAECGSDHFLLISKVLINYRKSNNKNEETMNEYRDAETQQFNLESLKQESTQFLYKLRLAMKLPEIKFATSSEEKYQQIKDCIHQASKEALGYNEKTPKKRNPEWWTEDIQNLVMAKKKSYQKWLGTKDPEDRKIYMTYNRYVKRMVAAEKNKMWERKCEEIERYMGGTRVSQAWKTIKNIRKDRREIGNINLISEKEWEHHYKTLLTESRDQFKGEIEEINARNEGNNVEEINVSEIRKTLKDMKCGKAPGPGNIPIELIKYAPDVLLEKLAELFNDCMIRGQNIPEDWNMAHISSIYKKGDRKQCKNYRGISVTSAMGRLYGRILKERIERNCKDIEEQSGFRAGRSCLDNVFTLQQLIEKRKARNLLTYLLFIDLEKAYDMVPLIKLFNTLTNSGLNRVYIRAIANIYKNPQCAIKIGNKLLKPFRVTKGLKQGCCLSPTLFKIYIQEALQIWRRKCSGMGIQMNDSCLTTLLFADDQVVVANCEDDMDYMIRKLNEEYEKWGMKINMEKTEYLKIGEEEEDPQLHIRNIKQSTEYKYLGSVISSEGTSTKDIETRIQQGQKCVRLLNPILWSNQINLNTKVKIYRTVVEPILTYGSECWQLTGKNRNRVNTVEMDFLRRSCRKSRLEHIRNEEIRRNTGRIFTTVDRIETRQLIWYGHVMRMNENRWPKKAINYIPEGRRRRGRPTTTWMEGVGATMRDRAIGEEDWRERRSWQLKCGMRQRL